MYQSCFYFHILWGLSIIKYTKKVFSLSPAGERWSFSGLVTSKWWQRAQPEACSYASPPIQSIPPPSGLAPQEVISLCLHYSRTRQLRATPWPRTHWNALNQSVKLFTLPRLIFPRKFRWRLLDKLSSCSCLCFLDKTQWSYSPAWLAVPLVSRGAVGSRLLLQWHWPLVSLLSYLYKLRQRRNISVWWLL